MLLYHYTTVDKLSLILESAKIRLNRLDRVDDLREGLSKDFGNCAHYLFVTCWTKSKTENIALWKMYSDGKRGVRIGMHARMFKSYELERDVLRSVFSDIADKSIVSDQTMTGDSYLIKPEGCDSFYAVKYSDQPEDLMPTIGMNHGCFSSTNIDSLGTVKSKLWEFQEEWRFKVLVAPGKIDFTHGSDEQIVSEHFNDFNPGNVRPNWPEYIDLEISPEAFGSMVITLSPFATKSEELIVEALVNKMNPLAKVEQSSLKGLIR
jgi:hypothetical protein